jgi:hypothetical protein
LEQKQVDVHLALDLVFIGEVLGDGDHLAVVSDDIESAARTSGGGPAAEIWKNAFILGPLPGATCILVDTLTGEEVQLFIIQEVGHAEWDELIRQFADEPDEYQRDGRDRPLLATWPGVSLSLRAVAGIGLRCGDEGDESLVPLPTFIQKEMLELPRLAAQICRALEKVQSRRPAPFIDGPAELNTVRGCVDMAACSRHVSEKYLVELERGTTRLLQLMAGAGKGK